MRNDAATIILEHGIIPIQIQESNGKSTFSQEIGTSSNDAHQVDLDTNIQPSPDLQSLLHISKNGNLNVSYYFSSVSISI